MDQEDDHEILINLQTRVDEIYDLLDYLRNTHFINTNTVNNVTMSNVPVSNVPVNNVTMNNVPVNNVNTMNNVNNVPENNVPENNVPENNVTMNNDPDNSPLNNALINNAFVNNANMNNIHAPVNSSSVNNGLVNNTRLTNVPLENNPENNIPMHNSPVNNAPAVPIKLVWEFLNNQRKVAVLREMVPAPNVALATNVHGLHTGSTFLIMNCRISPCGVPNRIGVTINIDDLALINDTNLNASDLPDTNNMTIIDIDVKCAPIKTAFIELALTWTQTNAHSIDCKIVVQKIINGPVYSLKLVRINPRVR